MSTQPKTNPQLPNYSYIPPQAIDLEEAILSAILIERDAITVVRDMLTPDSFYASAHSMIYASMCRLYDTSRPIDLLTLADEMKKNETLASIGGVSFLAQLASKVTSSANIEYHAFVVLDKFYARQSAIQAHKIYKAAMAEDSDGLELMDRVTQLASELTGKILRRASTRVGSAADALYRKITKYKDTKDAAPRAVDTGIEALDEAVGGLHATDFILVPADSGTGKTSWLLQVILNAARDQGHGVALASLELNAEQITGQLIANDAMVNKRNMRQWDKLSAADLRRMNASIDRIHDLPITIFDSAGITPNKLKSMVRNEQLRMQKLGKELKLVAIDYLQRMKADERTHSREQEVASISRALKDLALELEVPVLALSQINDKNKSWSDKRPKGDECIRESKAPYHDADMVMYLYRPTRYGFDEVQGVSMKGVVEAIIDKHRFSVPQPVPMQMAAWCGRFSDIPDPDLQNTNETPLDDPALAGAAEEISDNDLPF